MLDIMIFSESVQLMRKPRFHVAVSFYVVFHVAVTKFKTEYRKSSEHRKVRNKFLKRVGRQSRFI